VRIAQIIEPDRAARARPTALQSRDPHLDPCRMPILAVARLWFEGNAFSPLPTGLAQFAAREWTRGRAALAAARDTATELAGVQDVLAQQPQWRAELLRSAAANPGGPIEHAVFEAWCDEVMADLAALQADAVYLSLHGAAITDQCATADLEIVKRVRLLLPETPLAASFDLHGNLPPAIVAHLDFATGYRTYPHVDMRETAARAVARLLRIAAGAPAGHGFVLPLGLRLPSFNMRSEVAPMAPLLAQARALEQTSAAALDITLFGGFPYADTPDTGASVMAWAAGEDEARAACESIAMRWRACAHEFEPQLVDAAAGLRQAGALLAAQAADRPRPIAVTDPADNPLSGGAADTPGLLRALLAARAETGSPIAACAPGAIVFAYFFDPDLVARAREAGPGATLAVRLGARLDKRFGAAIETRAQVLLLTEGRFRNSGPMEHGSTVTLGATALFDIGGVRVIVTSSVGAANDPGFFTLHGIDPAHVRLLCVKAKNHFRAAFLPLMDAIIDVDCAGPAAADLAALERRGPQ